MHAADKHLSLIEAELKFIARHVSNMQTEDFEAQHEIHLAIESAKLALLELQLEAQTDTTEETPEGVSEPDGGGFLVTTYELVAVR